MLTRMAAALVAALLLAGCLPVTTTTPVGTTTGLNADPSLYGTWKGYDLKDKANPVVFFHFYKGQNDKMSAAMVEARGANGDGVTLFDVTTATLGRNRFINAVMWTDKGKPVEGSLKNTTFPVLYVRQGRSLTLYLLDEDKTRDAVRAGKIKGTVESGNNGDVVVTADAEELDAFMAKPEAKAMFRLLVELRKVD
jgi:hypothetical protein